MQSVEQSSESDNERPMEGNPLPATKHLQQGSVALSRRFWGICCVATLVVLFGSLFAWHQSSVSSSANSSATTLQGTALGGISAPAFSLPDQNGKMTSLTQFTGHPVVLTFFDSVCPHADCSLMAQYITASAQNLSAKQLSQVDWVAISLNPWHDTAATAQAFLSTRHVTMPLHFVLGTLAQLAPLWSAYHMQSLLQPNGVVIHTTGVYLLDQHSRERVFLEEGFNPQTLSSDVQLLLSNPQVANAKGAAGATTTQQTGYVSLTQTSATGVISLIATRGKYGTYNFEVQAWEAQGTPAEGPVNMTLTMTSMVMSPVPVPLNAADNGAPGVYQAKNVVSMTGGWQAVVTVTPGDGSTPIQATFNFNEA